MPKQPSEPISLFATGQIYATPGALEALKASGQTPLEFLARHLVGDWGDLPPEDRQANEDALQLGGRLFSAYWTKGRERVWIITESDRSATTLLLPLEY